MLIGNKKTITVEVESVGLAEGGEDVKEDGGGVEDEALAAAFVRDAEHVRRRQLRDRDWGREV